MVLGYHIIVLQLFIKIYFAELVHVFIGNNMGLQVVRRQFIL